MKFSNQLFTDTSWKFFRACLFCLSLSGCGQWKFSERIETSYQKVLAEQKAFEGGKRQGQQELTWPKAVALIRSQNLTYLRASQRLDELHKERESILWRQLDPRIRAVGTLGAALGELSSLTSSDYGLRLLGSISLPSPSTYYATRYGLELQIYQAELDLLLVERRLQASLYSYFIRQNEIASSASTRKIPSDESDIEGSIRDLLKKRTDAASRERQEEMLRLSFNDILDTPGGNWHGKMSSLPRISYGGKLSELNTENGYGQLALKQAAGQVEAGLVRVLQVKLARLPMISTGISPPTLYDSRGATDFDLGDTNLFGSMSRGFDFTGRDARRLEQAEIHADFLQRSLRQRLEREVSQLERLKTSYRLLVRDAKRMEAQDQWLKNNIPDGSSKLLLSHVEEMVQIQDSLSKNELARKQLDLQFWIWDENYWKKRQTP